VAGSELLTAEDRHLEELMLKIRLRTGLPADVLAPDELLAADQVVADGLMAVEGGSYVLTDRGRLLADAVVRTIAA
jgi:coproporphyrinogen III oxidase-like Fe-S oxidoreductase